MYIYTHTYFRRTQRSCRGKNVVKFPVIKSSIHLNFSSIIWRCCTLQFPVQTVHHKQEVGIKHCKTKHMV